MALSGSIPEVTVVDLMHLLHASRKSGVVRFSGRSGPGPSSGAIYFKEGAPVAAETEGLAGIEAVEMLCSWQDGRFEYQEGTVPAFENLAGPPGSVVQAAAGATEEWAVIRTLFPSSGGMVTLSREVPAGAEEIRLSRKEWSLIASMAAPTELSALAELAGATLSGYRMLKKLSDEGLFKFEGR